MGCLPTTTRPAAQRFAGQRELLRIVIGSTGLREGIDLETASDILYAVGSPETYRLLVVDRGWSGAHFERWYGETLERLRLDPTIVALATTAHIQTAE